MVRMRGRVRVKGYRVGLGHLDVGEGERALARLEVEVLGRLEVRVGHEALVLEEGRQLGHGAAVGLVEGGVAKVRGV